MLLLLLLLALNVAAKEQVMLSFALRIIWRVKEMLLQLWLSALKVTAKAQVMLLMLLFALRITWTTSTAEKEERTT